MVFGGSLRPVLATTLTDPASAYPALAARAFADHAYVAHAYVAHAYVAHAYVAHAYVAHAFDARAYAAHASAVGRALAAPALLVMFVDFFVVCGLSCQFGRLVVSEGIENVAKGLPPIEFRGNR